MKFQTLSAQLLAGLALTGTSLPASALTAESKTTPSLSAFAGAWANVTSYTETIVTHETTNDGKSTQDRTYSYKFLKPTSALIRIEDGPGKGGGAAWHGGDKVKGHQGGLLSGIKLIVPISDGRATSLRGDQIDVASFGYELNHFQSTPGALTEAPGPRGIARRDERRDEGNARHLERDASARQSVAVCGRHARQDRSIKDLKLNPGLKISNIDL